MNDELELFSKTQDPDHFKSALQIHQELEGKNSPVLQELAVNTKQLFQQGFQFADVAKYEHVEKLLTDVQNAQDNLNNNQDNEVLMNKFIQTCKTVRKQLKKQYGDQWNDPGAQYEDEKDE